MRRRIGGALVKAGMRMAGFSPSYSSTGLAAARSEWLPTSASINTLLAADGAKLWAQARDIERRNPWGRNAADSFVGNVIGTGIMPISLHPDPAVRARLHEAWRR